MTIEKNVQDVQIKAVQKEAQDGSHGRVVALALLAGIAGASLALALAAALAWNWYLAPLKERISRTPPVVVVDFVKLAQQYPEGASTEEVEALMLKTNQALLKLRDAGYVVIDAQAVLAAPDDVLVTSELLN